MHHFQVRRIVCCWVIAFSLGSARLAAFLGVSSLEKIGKVPQETEKIVKETFQDEVTWLDGKELKKKLKKVKLDQLNSYLVLLNEQDWEAVLKKIGVRTLFYGTLFQFRSAETKAQAEAWTQFELVKVDRQWNLEMQEVVSIQKARLTEYVQIAGQKKGKEAKKKALEEAVKEAKAKLNHTPFQKQSFPVIGNRASHLYHLVEVNHLPKASLQVPFASHEAAERQGYRPCPIDFPVLFASTEAVTVLEKLLGQEAAGEVERLYRMSQDPRLSQVKRVAKKLLPFVGRQSLRFRFRVLDTDMINALAVPGGIIYITKGMLDVLESDEELGAVLAHEFSHIVRNHALSQFRRYRDLSLLGTLSNVVTQGRLSLAIDFAQFLVLNGYDRRYEREADRDAVFLLYRVGWTPEAVLLLLRKLRDLEGSDPSKIEIYFRTHDSAKERIKRINELIQKKEAFFEQLNKP